MSNSLYCVRQRKGKPLPIPQRVKVLVVLHSDGWTEVYAERHVDVHIVQRLHIANPANVNLVDEYLESTLPRAYRDLYWPVKLRAFDQCRKATAADELDRRFNLQMLREIRNLGEVFNNG